MRVRIACMVLIMLVLAGCKVPIAEPGQTATTETPQPTPFETVGNAGTDASPGPDEAAIGEYRALLPDKAGFQWIYSGFAEYAMTMELKEITQSDGTFSYRCEGDVADMSDGEATGDFGVQVTYRATGQALMQELQGEKALDNVYPNLELIRAPLQKGTQWVQTVRDGQGRDASLSCSITDVVESDGKRVYFVTYQLDGGDYYEKREITEGMGVTAFDRLYEFEDTSELIGYRLYEPEEQAQAGTDVWEPWLPELGREYVFFGYAEYGHRGTLTELNAKGDETIYEYRGVYNDGTGKDDRFVLRYHADRTRGTVTEQVISNTRGGREVNSKLHNLVVLMFPLEKGSRWSHEAKLNGKSVTVKAEVKEYDEAQGIAKVRYTAKDAAGYHGKTYIEDRTFERGLGLTGFGNLLPGSIGISAADAKDPKKLEDALVQHMFGYSMNKTLIE